MKIKLACILLTILIIACCEKNTGHYVEKDRIPVLHVGDTILFESNRNRIDSFRVRNNYRGEQSSDKVFLYDFYILNYMKLNFDCASDIPYECDDYTVQIVWNYSSIMWRNFFEVDKIHSPSTNKVIKGVVYQKVNKISIDTTKFKTNDVVTVYYSDQQGVLRYELKSGEYFERIK